MSRLFTPLRVGASLAKNRIFMAPMTRGRATWDGVPTPSMVQYYAERSTAGLIVSEAMCVSPDARGWNQAPSIYTDAQVEGWRTVTSAVHKRGGCIYAQLWFLGRVSHPDFLDGALPQAPSAFPVDQHVHTRSGKKDCVTPREMELNDITAAIGAFGAASRRAREAGFDGVQVHAASGYLPDQFLRDFTNRRQDAYGGSLDKRLRFLREATESCCEAIGADRVSVRLSPRNRYNDIDDSAPETTFTAAAKMLSSFGLSFLDIMEPLPGHFVHVPGEPIWPMMRAVYEGVLTVNGGYNLALAEAALEQGADAVAFGIPFICNPDLVDRFRAGARLSAPDPDTFYAGGDRGYIDYPTLSEAPSTEEYAGLSLDQARRH